VNTNQVDKMGQTPLFKILIMIQQANPQLRKTIVGIVELLLEYGADPRQKPESAAAGLNHSALEFAKMWGLKDITDLFLKYSPEF